jgi:hypothetical protein
VYFAGIDWSGPTAPKENDDVPDFYVCALVAVQQPDILSEGLRRVRVAHGMAADTEFHAHNLPEVIQHAAIQEVLALQPRIAAVRYDKRLLRQRQLPIPNPSEFAHEAALTLLEYCLPALPLASLVFDEDIQGDKRQREFLTEVRQIARKTSATRLRTRFVRSRSHDLAQAADLLAHVLFRDAEQRVRLPVLRKCVQGLYASANMLLELP